MTKPCARCQGEGTEDEWAEQDCLMCGGSGEAVGCRALKDAGTLEAQSLFGPFVYCNRPSEAWDDESPVCHRHDPEVRLVVRRRVARARERVGA